MKRALFRSLVDSLENFQSFTESRCPLTCYGGAHADQSALREITVFLSSREIRIFDYARFAAPLRDAIRERAHELARSAGIEIEHLRKNHIRADSFKP